MGKIVLLLLLFVFSSFSTACLLKSLVFGWLKVEDNNFRVQKNCSSIALFSLFFLQIKELNHSQGFVSKLTIKKTTRRDTAVFECQAQNQFGRSKRVINLIVQVINSSNIFSVKYISVTVFTFFSGDLGTAGNAPPSGCGQLLV